MLITPVSLDRYGCPIGPKTRPARSDIDPDKAVLPVEEHPSSLIVCE